MLSRREVKAMVKTKALKGYKVVKSAPSYGTVIFHSGVDFTLVERDITRAGLTEKQEERMTDAISDYLDTFKKKEYNRVYYYAKKLNTKVDRLINWYGY